MPKRRTRREATSLKPNRQHVDPEEIATVKGADVCPFVESRGGCRQLIRRVDDVGREDELTGRVDQVEHQQQEADHPEIWALGEQDESVVACRQRLAAARSARALPALDHPVQQHRKAQTADSHMEQGVGIDAAGEQRLGECGAERAAECCADADDRKEPFGGGLIEEIVAVGPELGNRRVAEDADPDEERDADVRTPRFPPARTVRG